MKDLEFRPLKASEIDVRVGNVAKSGSGFFLLLYKNARVDQTILDETVGQWNWQCKYYQVKNTMVCSVGIYNEERNEWLWKDNGGDDDYQAEQVKAELSDAFKRACFNWGIGRELYYSPKIWVNQDGENDSKDHYSVKVIEYGTNKKITNLVIVNDKNKKVVFRYGKDKKTAETGDLTPKNDTPTVDEPKGSIDKRDLETIATLVNNFQNENSRKNFYAWLDNNFKTMSLENLTYSQGKIVLKRLGAK
ncbi:MAG: hypothetical protein J6S85_16730 [Methanobrevibacter sp.]|nr:hypothetical protein [Methanobrevibacter sp.]